MTVSTGRLFRPVLDDEVCHRCMVCRRGCPAELMPELRKEESSLRAKVYGKHLGKKIQDKPYMRPDKTLDMWFCQAACPLHQDAPGYIGKIAQEKYAEAVAIIRQTNALPGVLGYVCHHPCEAACTRNAIDEPISIRGLKRFAMKQGGAGVAPKLARKKSSKVAIIGSGPAGLAAAHDLALEGYPVEVIEAESAPGGMLRTAIPQFRLPREVLDADIDYIKKLGVNIRLGKRLGKDVTLDSLKKEGFAAIIIATGTHESMKMDIKGEDKKAIDCLSFLKDFTGDKPVDLGETVAVIGGGNAAIDTARSALRCGVKKCIVVYRRTQDEMPADKEEVKEAEAEGVEFQFLASPVGFTPAGKKRGLICIKNKLGPPDESGRRRPVAVKGSEFTVETDSIIAAVGQRPDISWAGNKTPLSFKSDNAFVVDDNLMTGVAGVFAAGDAVNGASTVVEAMASGKRVAQAVSTFLSGKGL